MGKHGTALNPGQVAEFAAVVVRQLPWDHLDPATAQIWIENQAALQDVLLRALVPLPSIETLLFGWKRFYKDFFGLELDFSQVRIPEHQLGFDRLLVIAQGLTPNQAFEACQKHFNCWRYTEDLDEATKGLNDREPTEHYAIWVRDRIEADEELKGLSANQLKDRNIHGITLLEREIYELKRWSEAGDHLDKENNTLCNGSRSSDGDVPFVGWLGGEMSVGWDDPRDADVGLRSRAVVS